MMMPVKEEWDAEMGDLLMRITLAPNICHGKPVMSSATCAIWSKPC
jgi:uncharacterized protein (DUF433 family)